MASTTALPPPTCTAWREAGQLHRRPLFCCEAGQRRLRLLVCCEAGQLLAVVASRPVPGRSSVGCVRLQRPCSAGYDCLFTLCHAMPTALIVCPVQCSFCFAPCSFPCAPGSTQVVVRTVPLAATTRACSGGPCAGSFLTLFLFLQSPLILGHGLV